MGVEGIPQRNVVVTFTAHYLSYSVGEAAGFTEAEAQRLADLGVVEGGGATSPPVNVSVPHVTQDGLVLSCTMGTWNGEPTSYAYQWKLDGTNAGTDAATYDAAPGDVGKTATCVVTATNGAGSTAAPPSDGLVIAEGTAHGRHHRRDRT